MIAIIFLFKRETFAPQLLYYKAKFFREATGDARFKTAGEASGSGSLLPVLKRNFTRPWLLLMEPIVIFFTFYLTIVYIVLFTFLDGYAPDQPFALLSTGSTNSLRYVYIFADTYGINEGLANICFLGLFIGILISMVLVPILYRKTAKQLRDAGDDGSGRMVDRESRLFFAQIGAPAIPIGLFWMGWTDYVRLPFSITLYECVHCKMLIILAFYRDLVPTSRLDRCRFRRHLYLPFGLHVHHRLLSTICSVGTDLCCIGSIPRCRRDDGGRDPDVSESWHSLDAHCSWDYQCGSCAYSLRTDLLGPVTAEAE